MDADTKLDNRIQMLLKKQEKHKVIIQTETERLKKTNEEITLLETKKKTRLMKNLFDNLQKEGINLDISKVDEIVHILKEKHDAATLDTEISIQEQEEAVSVKEKDAFVPSVAEAFR